jgi:hypothetical protein
VKVRITATPIEHELDGVRLDNLRAGSTREVSPSIAAWLITQGYAEPEMRRGPQENYFSGVRRRASASDTPRRRSTDR